MSPADAPAVNGEAPPAQVRAAIRAGEWTGPTAGPGAGFVQANLVVLRADAFDFPLFCLRNPSRARCSRCPTPGSPEPGARAGRRSAVGPAGLSRVALRRVGRGARRPRGPVARRPRRLPARLFVHLRASAPRRRAAAPPRRAGRQRADVPHLERVPARPAASPGPLVVSMRPMSPAQAIARRRSPSPRYPEVHGAPVHAGDPARSASAPGPSPTTATPSRSATGEIPVFWACGVTPQAVAVASRPG